MKVIKVDKVAAIVGLLLHGSPEEPIMQLINAIIEEQSFEAEPVRHGRWIFKRRLYEVDEYYCSECGQLLTTRAKEREKDCPNCRAKMDLKVKEHG